MKKGNDKYYRRLNNELNSARQKYLRAEIRMQIYRLSNGAWSADFEDTSRIEKIITDTIEKEKND
jgi:hypothetical protein